jgi:hypothetical protein
LFFCDKISIGAAAATVASSIRIILAAQPTQKQHNNTKTTTTTTTMATVHSGQGALMNLPALNDTKSVSSKEVTLASYEVSPNLQGDRKSLSATTSSGMEVFKVSKVSAAVDWTLRKGFWHFVTSFWFPLC